ncbi:hypothetical protein ACRS6Y_16175 [Bacillus cytotoxicus]|uniref:Uncharacterized protein n=1 Tax=Bacillus cytotoxicus TaxID=580165 RepID=A0AAX2CIJ8_9BACI|nr:MULTISPECIES: hypothetical protein [Bacillus cereus group]AWC33027.1 hypothetical protein CG482_011945 [Bacillus cytotoxicus]AWC45091.1 hypothetical protein CG479_011760 [Bacillus cytotoxicus]AWC61317.1 hypothetical protein CG474_012020 [Bacillus cytotoxicus]MDH2865469.1 hypothetical protein [Bacillus cytotoxicus]MDH2885295.1 hypothetical protein [Bacillus cytotoxicus]
MFYDQYSYNLNFRGPVNTFYEHINGAGSSFTMNSGEFKEVLEDWWSDRISSVLVAPLTLVVLYQHRGFGGRVRYLVNTGNSPQLFNLVEGGWGDNTSSIKTYRLCY